MQSWMKRRIHELWNSLTEFGAARIEAGLEYALKELSLLLDAQQAYWLCGVKLAGPEQRDPLFGWRPRAIRYLHPASEFDAVYSAQRRRIDRGDAGSDIVAKVREAGQFRVIIDHEITPDDWFRSDLYQNHYGPLGIQDVILVATPLGPDVESWFAFERIRHPKPFFEETDRELLDYAVRPLRWFHRLLLLHRGLLLTTEPLKPSERRLLNWLHTEKSEREIAEELGLSPATVHTYATRIYRKFNVKGRTGLAALWLGQMPQQGYHRDSYSLAFP